MSEEKEEFPVIKGVPVPPPERRHKREGTKYPFLYMDIGDHFPATRAYSTLNKAILRYLKTEGGKGRQFVIRKSGTAWGVWRVK